MSVTEAQYFALLRSALWDTPVAIEEEVDWDAVMQLAKHHTTNVLLSGVASQITGNNRPSDSMLGEMQSAMRLNLMNQLQLRRILTSAVKLLQGHDIEPVLLKGFSLAMLYPNPSLRQFGDIDLYVGLENFHKACKLLCTLPGGYNWREEEDSGRHYNIEFGHYPMEVHRVSADLKGHKEKSVYESIERNGLFEEPQRVDFESLQLLIPSKEFMVFYTFFHAWNHFLTTGVGWRQISDLAVTLHAYQGQLDLNKLYNWIISMHLLKPWQTFGYLLVDNLGLQEAEMPFYDSSCRHRAHKLFSRVMAEGNFRRTNRFKHNKQKGAGINHLHSFIGIFVSFFQLAAIFPGQAFREMISSLKIGFGKNFKKNEIFTHRIN